MKTSASIEIEIEHDGSSDIKEILEAMLKQLNEDLDIDNPNDYGVTRINLKYFVVLHLF